MPQGLDRDAAVLVTGGQGMLGRAVCAQLAAAGHTRVLAPPRQQLDLLDGAAVQAYFAQHRPAYVFHLAAMVFGLGGNLRFKFQMLSTNTLLNHNVLSACAATPPRRIFFAGTVASYPYPYRRLPLEEVELTGAAPHAGEFGYAQAKMHALSYLTVLQQEYGIGFTYGVLTNLYGPHDRFDIENGHVVPSLVCKVHKAVNTGNPFLVWGDGTAIRDFMHVEDAARAAVLVTAGHDGTINICSGEPATIRDVVTELTRAAGWAGEVVWQVDKPTGIQERSVSASRLQAVGFKPNYSLASGLAHTYSWYAANSTSARLG